MTILSIQLGHNSTAGLLIDGKIVGVISEEKFDNIKNSSAFPKQSIKWLLSEFNVKNIDCIAVSGLKIYPSQMKIFENNKINDNKISFKRKMANNLFLWWSKNKTLQNIYFNRVLKSQESIQNEAKNKFFSIMSKLLNDNVENIKKKTEFVEHHKCHTYSAFYSLNKDKNEDALIFTLDGSGDYYCATVNKYSNGKIERLASTNWLYSVGYIYSKTTLFLGLKPLEHEYKVMGLAPYAKNEYVKEVYEKFFKDVIWLKNDNKLEFEAKIPTNRFELYLKENVCMQRFDNIAGAVQMLVESLVTEWIKEAIKQTGIKKIYTGGGVFMNVKLNQKIAQLDEVEYANFMPSCGDESNPIGAAYYISKEKFNVEPKPLKDIFLGLEFSNEEIKEYIEKNNLNDKYNIKFIEDIEEKIADLLANNNIVARFNGRCEWGARSLGNRAILGNPSNMESFYEVNDMIKKRDFWMPFAPSILEEDSNLYIDNPKKLEALYMILGFDTKPLAREHLRAAMHQADYTIRPQIVKKELNPKYWKLINYFKQKTGISGVMNTSFNLHGYPLVGSIEQAIFTFENSGLKYLALENYLVIKNV